jgi:peptidoglycan/LPS O-acetylase OafA/YrhL
VQQRIEYIDFAKGYAIFTIVCYHALQQVALSSLLQKAIIFGGTGVHLFFLLSGFGLAWSAAKDSALDFYRRRMSTVWVPYVVVLTISWAAAAALGIFPDGWDAWLASAGLYQMFSERYIESFGGHFWFISTIFQFYLVFPLLIRLQKKVSTRTFLTLAFLLSLAWWGLVYFSGKSEFRVWNSFFLQFLWEFAIGMALAKAMKEQKIDLRPALETDRYDGMYLVAGVVFTAIMIGIVLKMGAAGRVFNDVPALLGYTALSLFVYRMGSRWLPALNGFFLWVNGFSYSLYLIHVLVLHLLLWAMGLAAFHFLTVLLYLLLALAAAWGFERGKRAMG